MLRAMTSVAYVLASRQVLTKVPVRVATNRSVTPGEWSSMRFQRSSVGKSDWSAQQQARAAGFTSCSRGRLGRGFLPLQKL